MSKCKGYATLEAKAALGPFSFERRAPREHDVVIDIKYCGICHSDIHQARNEWSDYQEECIFPMVPGHEIAGMVSAVGGKVTKYKVGDKVASDVLSILAAHARNADRALNSTARWQRFGRITHVTSKARPLMADIQTGSSWTRTTCCACQRACRWKPVLRC